MRGYRPDPTPHGRNLWLCLRCAREGRRHIYTDKNKTTCPYGHKRERLFR